MPPVTTGGPSPLDAATFYARKRFAPIPLPRAGVPNAGKNPGFEGWQNLRLTEESDLAREFSRPDLNLGLLLGLDDFGQLADVDLDSDEAVRAAPFLLPATGWVSGRKGRPSSHWWYRCSPAPARASEPYLDPCLADKDRQAAMLLELRGRGGLTVVPPGQHVASGETLRWERRQGDYPTGIDLDTLRKAVRRLAAAALLARYWSGPGGRHHAALALAGGLLRAGWPQDEAEAFIEAVATAALDPEIRDRVRAVASTVEERAENHQVQGWPTLARSLGQAGDAVVGAVREWLGLTTRAQVPARAASGSQPKPAPYVPLPAFEPFPVQALPPVARDYTTAAAEAIGCDPSMVALPLLATLAGAIGNSRWLFLKAIWSEPPALWAATVAPSGSMKTPAWNQATGPLMDIQIEEYERHAEDVREFNSQVLGEWAAKPKDTRGEKPNEPPEPATLMAGDATIEALQDILANAPRGVLVAHDELDGWFQSFSRYKGAAGGSDRPKWLELHKGGTLRNDRVTREKKRIIVRRALVSICGTIQPEVLAQALDPGALASGLAARFLFTMPPRTRKEWTEATVDEGLKGQYLQLLRDLLALEMEDTDKRKPHFLRLSPAAKDLWVPWYNEWAGVQYDSEGAQAAAFAKLESYSARFALIHHVCTLAVADVESHDRPIGAGSMEAGITLAKWFAQEATRLYQTLRESHQERDTRRLVEWVQRQGGHCTARQLQKANGGKYPSRDLAEAALGSLVDLGLADWTNNSTTSKGGRPTKVLRLRNTQAETDETDTTPNEGDDGGAPARILPTKPNPTQPGGTMQIPRENGGSVGSVGQGRTKEGGAEPSWEPNSPEGVVSGASEVVSGGCVGWGLESPTPQEGREGSPDETDITPSGWVLVRSAEELDAVGQALDETGDLVALDLETTGLDPRTDRVRLLQLGTDRGTFLVDCFQVDPSPLWERLAEHLLVGHNLKFDLGFLARLGFEPVKVADTLLLAGLLTAGTQAKLKLPDCCHRWLGQTVDKTEQRSDWSGTLTQAQLDYAARDVDVLRPLHARLTEEIRAAGLEQAAEIENRSLLGITWLSGNGVQVDRPTWEKLAQEASAEVARLKEEMTAQAPPVPVDLWPKKLQTQVKKTPMFPPTPPAWEWGSPQQMARLLALLGHQVESTDDNALARIPHPMADLLRQHRAASKLAESYGMEWLKYAQADDRIYPDWRQQGAATGRMSCGKPNLQQVPRGAHRRCVVAPPGKVLVKADYSQLELRIAAKVSGDKVMLEAYRTGKDLHTLTAQAILGKDDVTKQDRQLAKAVNFGLVFGAGAPTLVGYAKSNYGVEMTLAEAEAHRAAFFKTYPGLQAWHRRIGQTQKNPVDTRTLTGRRRLEVKPFTQKANTPVQGTGGDGIKLALALLWERRYDCPGARPVLAVHDEIVLEVDAEQAQVASEHLKRAMVDALADILAPIPVVVDVTIGRTWGGD